MRGPYYQAVFSSRLSHYHKLIDSESGANIQHFVTWFKILNGWIFAETRTPRDARQVPRAPGSSSSAINKRLIALRRWLESDWASCREGDFSGVAAMYVPKQKM